MSIRRFVLLLTVGTALVLAAPVALAESLTPDTSDPETVTEPITAPVPEPAPQPADDPEPVPDPPDDAVPAPEAPVQPADAPVPEPSSDPPLPPASTDPGTDSPEPADPDPAPDAVPEEPGTPAPETGTQAPDDTGPPGATGPPGCFITSAGLICPGNPDCVITSAGVNCAEGCLVTSAGLVCPGGGQVLTDSPVSGGPDERPRKPPRGGVKPRTAGGEGGEGTTTPTSAGSVEEVSAGELPFTGAPLLIWLVFGFALWAGGLLLRRATSPARVGSAGSTDSAMASPPGPARPAKRSLLGWGALLTAAVALLTLAGLLLGEKRGDR